MTSFVDTNVLVYLFDRDSPHKRTIARNIFKNEGLSGNLILSTQVLQEFYVSVTRKLATPLNAEAAYRATLHLSFLPLVIIESSLVLSAIRRSRQFSLSFWDALIVQSALQAGVERLWSEDMQDGQVIEDLRIENPFARTGLRP